MSEWQPIETCPENTWVLLPAEWDSPPINISKFRWVEFSEWETIHESAGASGARRQTRQETKTKRRVWDNGIGEHNMGSDYSRWMPLPEI